MSTQESPTQYSTEIFLGCTLHHPKPSREAFFGFYCPTQSYTIFPCVSFETHWELRSSFYLCSNLEGLKDTARTLLLQKALGDGTQSLQNFYSAPEISHRTRFSVDHREVETELHSSSASINSFLSTSGTLPSLKNFPELSNRCLVSLITSKLHQQVEEGEKDQQTVNLYLQATFPTHLLLPSAFSSLPTVSET